MTFHIKGRKNHHRHSVVFKRRAVAEINPSSSSSASLSNQSPFYDQKATQSGILVADSGEPDKKTFLPYRPSHITHAMSAKTASASMIPDLFTKLPLLRDQLVTESSQVQEETVHECIPFLSGIEAGITYNDYGVPHLDRKRHVRFLHKSLTKLPAAYVAADASKPWMFYWALAGLSTMGEDVSEYREKVIASVRPSQNITGGFGGGNGQMSHLAPTYAVVLSLAMVGGKEALDIIDRKAMWKWLGDLKQHDGGFQMAVGGEVDAR